MEALQTVPEWKTTAEEIWALLRETARRQEETDDSSTCHYLEADPEDISGTKMWASSGHMSTNISGTGTAIGTGRKNAALILATDADAPAAKACKDLTAGGKTDWFLPSEYELAQLRINRASVGALDTGLYWSSSQVSSSQARIHNFYSPDSEISNKNQLGTVRAVRAF